LTLEVGTDRLSRNIGNELPPYAVVQLRRAQISSISREKPEISHSSISESSGYNNQHTMTKFLMYDTYSQGRNFSTISRHPNNNNKGKAISLQAWTGPEGSRRLRLSEFKTIDT
jgi:hypothetical protein